MQKRVMQHPHKKTFTLTQQTLTGLVMVGSLAAQPAAADNTAQAKRTQQTFHISGGTLSHALSQFAGSAGIVLSADARLTDGKASRGLNGQFSVAEGLSALLAGSGLTYQYTANGSVLVSPAPKPVENLNQADPTELPAVKVTGKAVYAESKSYTNKDNDPYNKSYTSINASTATKTNTPIFDTPVSIQVVPRAVMDDQKASSLKDTLENVSGVRPQTTIGYGNGFIIRGFRNPRVFRNGLIGSGISIGGASEFDAANIESVEVLKGPAAILFGRIEPGGMVNINTKRPKDEREYALEQRFGSYDFYRTEWDATGAVNADESVLYRFAGSYQNNESFRDFNFNDRVMVHPSLTWRPSDATEIGVDVEATHQDFQVDRGLFAIGNRPASIPITRSFIDPDDPVDSLSKVNVGFNLTHAFNKDWTIRNRFLATFNDSNEISVKPANAFNVAQFTDPSANKRTYLRNIFAQDVDSETYSTNLDLTGNFKFLGVQHQSLIGFDFLSSTGTYLTRGNFQASVPGLEIDIYNPVYGINPSFYANALATPFPAGTNHSYFRDEWYGVYFQDHITLWDKLHILGGGRYDWATTGRGQSNSFEKAEAIVPSRNDEGFSPRVGILYQPWDWMSIYGNWTTSFGANNGVTATGGTIDPQIGEQYEAGFKTELFDRRLSTTVAYYHLTKENILTRDFNSPNPSAVAAIGEARSQGIEMDMVGKITDGLSIIGSYAFTDARITKDFSGLQGKRMNNVPEHSGSLWLKYEINDYVPLNGWSFGVGMFAAGQREGDEANTFELPGYVRLDAFSAYRYQLSKDSKLIAQFNIRNLLDKTYYDSTDPFQNGPPRTAIYPGAPLTAMGSIRLEF